MRGGRRRFWSPVAPLRRGKGGGAGPVRCRAVRGTRSGALLEPRRGGGCGSTVSRACRRPWHGRPSCARAGRAMALFIGARWRGGGSGRAGKRSTGVGAAGEGAARRGVWLGHGNIVASRRGTGACVELGGTPGELVRGKPRGAGAVLGGGATRGAARWLCRRTDAARRPSAGRREVEEPASGNFVIRPKFQNPVL